MSERKISPARRICVTGIMAAAASILMLLEFPLPFVPSFLKFDFSELPALIAAFCFGPVEGVAVCLIKNLVKLISTTSGGVGELANFTISVCFVVPAGLIYRYGQNRKGALIGCIAGTVLMGIISFPINYYIVYPAYAKILPIETIIGMYREIFPEAGGLASCLLIFNLPFTLLKGIADSLITFLIYKRLSPILKGNGTSSAKIKDKK